MPEAIDLQATPEQTRVLAILSEHAATFGLPELPMLGTEEGTVWLCFTEDGADMFGEDATLGDLEISIARDGTVAWSIDKGLAGHDDDGILVRSAQDLDQRFDRWLEIAGVRAKNPARAHEAGPGLRATDEPELLFLGDLLKQAAARPPEPMPMKTRPQLMPRDLGDDDGIPY